MSTKGIGISPAAPDHSEKRSTSFDAASSRSASVIVPKSVVSGSLLSAVPPAVVSCAILGSFLVTCTRGPRSRLLSQIDQWVTASAIPYILLHSDLTPH